MRALALAIGLSAATPVAAEPFLALPIDCTPGTDCYVEDYMDIDPGPGVTDFACGLKARAGHDGTDFALPDMAAMDRGVAVTAAAPGVVAATRDGMDDRIVTPETLDDLAGRDCGNAVRILHANGLQTLYCHLAQGSVRVSTGDAVATGDPIGRVGLSGRTTFPHLHFEVLDGAGEAIDPFHPGATPDSCGALADTLWLDPPVYRRTGFATAGFTTAVPTFDAVRSGAARADVARPSDPLVVYARIFHAEPDDRLHFAVRGPTGPVFSDTIVLDDPRLDLFRAYGRRAPDGGWPTGTYTAETRLTRGDGLVGARQAYVTVAR